MSRSNLVSNAGFGERCKTFYRMKGVVQPTCGCGACWNEYFRKNPTKTAAARLALTNLGKETIIWAQGKDFALALEQREDFEIRAGIRRHRSDYVAAAVRRGTKYLRNLLRFLNEEDGSDIVTSKFAHGDPADGQLYIDNNLVGNVTNLEVPA